MRGRHDSMDRNKQCMDKTVKKPGSPSVPDRIRDIVTVSGQLFCNNNSDP
jgi:hypothetical protein